MTKQPLGDIPLRDYLRMASVRRPFRRTRALVLGVACVAAFAAGRFGPWRGQNTDALTFEEAVKLLEAEIPVDWHNENAAGALFNNVRRGIELLNQLGAEDNNPGVHATSYVGKLALLSTTGFVDALSQYPERKPKLGMTLRNIQEIVR
jgi:hypothetical protein